MDELMFARKAGEIEVRQHVFVTGLARSGTTAVMNRLFNTGAYASLQYANMPFLLCPNLWKRHHKISAHERAHNDGIVIDSQSPEEFDEYFWKVYLKDGFIRDDGLVPHRLDTGVIDKYLSYTRMVCLAKGKDRYLSKNNNNILRLPDLRKIAHSQVILLFREPLAHASSLWKLDRKFTETQKQDAFILDYFNYLGHHEFGLNHKPFLLTEAFNRDRSLYPKGDINYWLLVWKNYYVYLLQIVDESFLCVCFEDLIEDPQRVYSYLGGECSVEVDSKDAKKHQPSQYPEQAYDKALLQKCTELYEALKQSVRY